MTISVKIIEHSRAANTGIELITYQLTYPRFVHSELMTHRVFSRNASSSRAIPIMRMLRNTVSDMALPSAWGTNKPGMQAGEEMQGWRRRAAQWLWKGAGYAASGFAWCMAKLGAHKQIVNRIMEPWSHISVVLTATDFANWEALRDHPDADPTIHELASKMRAARLQSKPNLLAPGEWHLPYVMPHERLQYSRELLLEISAARCARVSYLTHDRKEPRLKDDRKLFDRLARHNPMHASPLEHQATPDERDEVLVTLSYRKTGSQLQERKMLWRKPELHGNFTGYVQFRKTLEGEFVRDEHHLQEWAHKPTQAA